MIVPLRDAWREAAGIVTPHGRPEVSPGLDPGDTRSTGSRPISSRSKTPSEPADPSPTVSADDCPRSRCRPSSAPGGRRCSAAPGRSRRGPPRRSTGSGSASGPWPGAGRRPRPPPAESSTSARNPGRPASAPMRSRDPTALKDALVGGGKRGQTLGVSTDDLLQQAVAAHVRNDLTETERLCRRVLRRDATEPSATQLLGAVLSERDDAEGAIELFEAAAPRVGKLDANNLGFYNNYANALRRGKQHDQAEVILREIVGVDSKSWHAWHNLGQVLKDCERYDEAVAPLRRAVTLAPEHGPNHAVLGEVLYHIGRLRSADASLRRCIELGWDTDVNLWTLLGNTQRLLGDLPEAIVCLEHALELSNGSRRGAQQRLDRVRTGGPVRRRDRAPAHLDQARARRRHHALQRVVRAADGRRDRRGLERVGVGAARPARQRTPDEQAALDSGGPRRPRALLPRAGRRRRDPLRVVLSRPHRGGERRRDRDRSARRDAVRPVVPRRRSTRADDQPRPRRDDARLRLRDPGREPAAVFPIDDRRLPRPPVVPRGRPRTRRRVARHGSPRSGRASSWACRGAAA